MASKSPGCTNLRIDMSTRFFETAQRAEQVGDEIAPPPRVGGGRPIRRLNVPRNLQPLTARVHLNALVVAGELAVGESQIRPCADVVGASGRIVLREPEQHV